MESSRIGKGRGAHPRREQEVGRHGPGTVKEAVAQCMLDQDWVPVYPPGPSGNPNQGCLVVEGRWEVDEVDSPAKESPHPGER